MFPNILSDQNSIRKSQCFPKHCVYNRVEVAAEYEASLLATQQLLLAFVQLQLESMLPQLPRCVPVYRLVTKRQDNIVPIQSSTTSLQVLASAHVHN